MSVSRQKRIDFWINWGKLYRMNIRKWEFMTEVILSLFVIAVTMQEGGSAEFAAGAIAVIHSFNVARAIESYKEAKVDTNYQSTLNRDD